MLCFHLILQMCSSFFLVLFYLVITIPFGKLEDPSLLLNKILLKKEIVTRKNILSSFLGYVKDDSIFMPLESIKHGLNMKR